MLKHKEFVKEKAMTKVRIISLENREQNIKVFPTLKKKLDVVNCIGSQGYEEAAQVIPKFRNHKGDKLNGK